MQLHVGRRSRAAASVRSARPWHGRTEPAVGRCLLLVRGRDGIEVFHNVCRHRGLLLCDEPRSMPRIRSPYHGWTYGLDGSLQATPYWDGSHKGGPDDTTRDQLHLEVVASAVWAGVIFVHSGPVDRSFADASAALSQRWAALDLGRLAHVATRRFDIAANWKLVVENFLDFYHLPFIHPQVGPPQRPSRWTMSYSMSGSSAVCTRGVRPARPRRPAARCRPSVMYRSR